MPAEARSAFSSKVRLLANRQACRSDTSRRLPTVIGDLHQLAVAGLHVGTEAGHIGDPLVYFIHKLVIVR